jgi:2-aminoadipate transaminase
MTGDAMQEEQSRELFFDKWEHLYSDRTQNMRSSEVRDLLAVTERPDIIALAGGAPYTKALNLDRMTRILNDMLKNGPEALNYGSSEGYEPLRTWLTEFMAEEDVICTPDDILITDGSQQGLELVGKIFINPGDVIIAEAPSYVGGLNAFLSFQADIIQIPCDDHGIKVELVAQKLEQLKKKGILPRFIYVIPSFQNPSGVTMSLARRKKLAKLAREYNTLIVEDNAYRRLSFEEEPLASIKTLDPDNVIYLGTFSKILSPGLRVGWVVAPRPIREKLIFAKQAADLCSSSLTQRVVAAYFAETDIKAHLKRLSGIYIKRRDKMLAACEEYFPRGVKWTHPKGGFFVWVTLPDYLDSTNMLAKAVQQKVAYVPGKAFFADGTGRNCMRLNYSFMKESEIREGVRRLAEVVEQEMELYKSLKL